MEIILSAVKSRKAVDNWEHQYKSTSDPAKIAITKSLQALSLEQRTATAISAIIGNKSWTHTLCGECCEYCDVAVALGSEDYPAHVCLPCLKAAQAAVVAASFALQSLGFEKEPQ